MSSTATIPRRALVLLVILTLVWGTNWPLFIYAVREVSVWTFRAVALLASGGVLLLVATMRGQSLRVERKNWPVLVAASMCYLAVWNIASTLSAVMIPSGQSAVLGFTMPLWAALLTWAVWGQKPNARSWWALALGALAVLLLMLPNFKTYAQAPLGLALGLLAAVGWAVGTLILKRNPMAEISATVLTGWQLLITALPICAMALWLGRGEPWFMPSMPTVAVIAYIALVPMCIGNLCWFSIVGLLPANVAGLSSIMVPVVAMLSGAWLHGEPLGALQALAMACSVASLTLILLKPR